LTLCKTFPGISLPRSAPMSIAISHHPRHHCGAGQLSCQNLDASPSPARPFHKGHAGPSGLPLGLLLLFDQPLLIKTLTATFWAAVEPAIQERRGLFPDNSFPNAEGRERWGLRHAFHGSSYMITAAILRLAGWPTGHADGPSSESEWLFFLESLGHRAAFGHVSNVSGASRLLSSPPPVRRLWRKLA